MSQRKRQLNEKIRKKKKKAEFSKRK